MKHIILFLSIVTLGLSATCAQYERVLSDRSIISTGVYSHKQESIAINLAEMMALNSIAKQAGEVLQKEDSTLYNDKVHMIITTKASNIIRGYQVLSKTYDESKGRAEVVIKQDGKVLASEFCKILKIY